MNVKKDFPIFENNEGLIYLDSSATSQSPKQVINAIADFYNKYKSNIHRGVYDLSEMSTELYEKSKEKCASFLNCNPQEIIYTKNATEALNLAAYSLTSDLKEGDEVLVTEMEHHSNFVPWQQLCKSRNLKFSVIKVNEDFTLENIENKITEKTKILALTHVSNATGSVNDIKEICKLANENNIITVIDGCQSAPHKKIDLKDLNCDFFAFSVHKMLGPMGLGILFGKEKLLEKLSPFLYGGDMIRDVRIDDTDFNDIPWKFEAGTPNVAAAVGFSAAIDYLNKIGMENIEKYENELKEYALEKLSEVEGIKIYKPKSQAGIISFNLYNNDKLIHPHDVSAVLNDKKIAIRSGHHCAQVLMDKLKVPATCRISFYIYNTKEDIDKVAEALKEARKVFN
ncbi:SufS family cysteine desulfurase [Candidatus Woesearchaeota archaeon]|nr:SufS family cysteine desulfurase [Candidatus Woesearchaeota archaeon]